MVRPRAHKQMSGAGGSESLTLASKFVNRNKFGLFERKTEGVMRVRGRRRLVVRGRSLLLLGLGLDHGGLWRLSEVYTRMQGRTQTVPHWPGEVYTR